MAAAILTIAPLDTSSPASADAFSFTQIDVPGAGTQARGINDAGQIVGIFFPNTAGIEGFLDTRGSFTQIHVPGAIFTDALGINDAGQIVGGFTDTTGATHGFLDTRGSFTQIDVPGLTPGAQTFTVAFGINDAGQIVGEFILSIEFIAGTHHGFLDNGGIFTQIDAPGAVTGAGNGTIASGINDAGQIVGSVNFGHGFLATPIPEPSTLLLFGVGLAGLGIIRRGRFDRPPAKWSTLSL